MKFRLALVTFLAGVGTIATSLPPAHAQTVTPNLLPEFNRLRINSGELEGTYRLMHNDGRVNWYFCNLALMRFVSADEANKNIVRTYLNQYVKHVNPTTGIIRDYADGKEVRADSDDAYCSTFLTLASLYRTRTADEAWWKTNLPLMKNIATKTLLAPQKESGLIGVRVNPIENIGYLMDNCQNYRGLADFAAVLTKDNDPDAAKFAESAAKVAKGILSLYRPERGAFDQADIPGNTNFYPERNCQPYPELYRVPLGTPEETKKMYDAAWTYLNARGDKWEVGQIKDTSLGGFPWMILGYAAARRGDKEKAKVQFDFYVNLLKSLDCPTTFTAVHEVSDAIALQAELNRK